MVDIASLTPIPSRGHSELADPDLVPLLPYEDPARSVDQAQYVTQHRIRTSDESLDVPTAAFGRWTQ